MPDYKDPVLVSQYYDKVSRGNAENTYNSITSVDRSNSSKADARAYQRQAELNRLASLSSTVSVASDVAMYSGASATAALAGGSGMLSGMAAPMIATAIPMAFVGKSIDDYVSKRRSIHSIGRDLDAYGGRTGFGTPLTYAQSTALGGAMHSEFNRGGGFFNSEQQDRIHKIGLSNDMMSARGGAGGGSVQQYKDNFRKLKDTTEEVVKLMKTTIEGGMDIIKGMQNMGFGSLDDIRNQVKQTKAYGNMAGIGTANMNAVGAAGASYAMNNNPYWSSSSGARAFQTGAASASYIAAGSQGGRDAVSGVGGVANAGSIIASTQMENLQGSIGTRMMSYAMNPDGTIDQGKLTRIMSRDVSAYGLVSGSNQSGYNMGESGRAIFGRNKRQALNEMSPDQLSRLDQRAFELWGQGRGGTTEAKAWVYAGQKTSGDRERELYYQSLTNPRGYGQMRANSELVGRTANPLYNTKDAWWGRQATDATGEFIDASAAAVGQGIISPILGGLDSYAKGKENFVDAVMGGAGRFLLRDKSYTHGDQGLGSQESSLRAALGISRPNDMARGSAALEQLRTSGKLNQMAEPSPEIKAMFNKFNPNDLNTKQMSNLNSILSTASFQNDPANFFKRNSMIRDLTGISNSQANQIAKSGEALNVISFLGSRNNQSMSTTAKAYDMSQKNLDKWLSDPTLGMSDKDKNNMIGNATEALAIGRNMNGIAPEVQQYVRAKNELHSLDGVKSAQTRMFGGFNRKGMDSDIQSLFKSGKQFGTRSFREFAAGRNYKDENVALDMMDELFQIQEKTRDGSGYNLNDREKQIIKSTSMMRSNNPMLYKRIREANVQRLGTDQKQFYSSRSRMAMLSAEENGIEVSSDMRSTLLSGDYDLNFIQNNAKQVGNIFGVNPDQIGKLKSTKEAEWLLFNNSAAKQKESSEEYSMHKKNAQILANSIISGSSGSVSIQTSGKDAPVVVNKENALETLQATKILADLTQSPMVATSDYGKSNVINTQPPVLNHWNQEWS